MLPSVICFVFAGAFLFAAARRVYRSALAALAAVLIFALNPNMLYLQSTPMTEPLFALTLAALLWSTLWFRDSQSVLAILAASAASNAASLTRYEGWFLIPFVALYFFGSPSGNGMRSCSARWRRSRRWPGSRTIASITEMRWSFTTVPGRRWPFIIAIWRKE